MKNYFYKIVLLSTLILGLVSCEEDGFNSYTQEFVTFDDVNSSIISAPENGGILEIPVTLAKSQTTDLVVNFTVIDSLATRDLDYSIAGNSITIPAGEVSVNIEVNLIDNAILNPLKNFKIELSSTSDSKILLGLSGQSGSNSKIVNIINDDCPSKSNLWYGALSAEDVGFATGPATGSSNADGTCDVLVISGDLPGFGTSAFLPISFVFTPSAPNSPTGTVVASRQTFCNTCNGGAATSYEATGTYNETTKTINVNYTFRRANGSVFYTGGNIIRKL